MTRTPAKPRPPLEKHVEAIGRRMMTLLGFQTWHLSQARATNQTPGWPDMLFTHRERGLAVWWEAKRPGGKQSPAQREFELSVTACGQHYVCGTDDDLKAWCIAQRVCLP
jgi:hypothetical protein